MSAGHTASDFAPPPQTKRATCGTKTLVIFVDPLPDFEEDVCSSSPAHALLFQGGAEAFVFSLGWDGDGREVQEEVGCFVIDKPFMVKTVTLGRLRDP